jgi:hypothetical protein
MMDRLLGGLEGWDFEMCKPGDTTADLRQEAELLEGREGIGERRVGETAKQKAALLTGLVSVLSLLAGVFVAPFFVNVRGVAGLEKAVESMNATVESIHTDIGSIRKQVEENTRALAVGGRYTLEEELEYRAKQADKEAKLRERVAILEYKAGVSP